MKTKWFGTTDSIQDQIKWNNTWIGGWYEPPAVVCGYCCITKVRGNSCFFTISTGKKYYIPSTLNNSWRCGFLFPPMPLNLGYFQKYPLATLKRAITWSVHAFSSMISANWPINRSINHLSLFWGIWAITFRANMKTPDHWGNKENSGVFHSISHI